MGDVVSVTVDRPEIGTGDDGSTEIKLKDVYCYREGGGMYQDDYERLLQCQAETVRMAPLLYVGSNYSHSTMHT